MSASHRRWGVALLLCLLGLTAAAFVAWIAGGILVPGMPLPAAEWSDR